VVARSESFMPGGRQSAEEVSRRAIAALVRGQRTIIPYFGGWFTAMLVRFLPVGLVTRSIEKIARPKANLG
jgi:short-subunit dehydrogenase